MIRVPMRDHQREHSGVRLVPVRGWPARRLAGSVSGQLSSGRPRSSKMRLALTRQFDAGAANLPYFPMNAVAERGRRHDLARSIR